MRMRDVSWGTRDEVEEWLELILLITKSCAC